MAGLAACLCCVRMAVLTTPPRRVPEQSLYLDLGLKGQTCESVRSFLPFRIWADCIDPLSFTSEEPFGLSITELRMGVVEPITRIAMNSVVPVVCCALFVEFSEVCRTSEPCEVGGISSILQM